MSVVVELKSRKRQHVCDVVRHPEDRMFKVTFQPVCREDACYVGPFVASERRAQEIGLEHTRKASGTWRPGR